MKNKKIDNDIKPFFGFIPTDYKNVEEGLKLMFIVGKYEDNLEEEDIKFLKKTAEHLAGKTVVGWGKSNTSKEQL
jgi:hypothetical protein